MDPSGFRGLEAHDHIERRGFARAVRTQKPYDLAGFDVQRNIIDHASTGVRFLQIESRQCPRRRFFGQAGGISQSSLRFTWSLERRRCYGLRQLYPLGKFLFAKRAVPERSLPVTYGLNKRLHQLGVLLSW